MGGSALDEERGGLHPLERWQRLGSWLAVGTFAVCFVALLGLSATPYWTPDNPWLPLLDHGWRASGLLALVLGLTPYAIRLGRLLVPRA